jgi:hypothetical protein
MRSLIAYGDFNCPFSRVASARVDALLQRGSFAIEWRAVQHDPDMPVDGIPMEGSAREQVQHEIDELREGMRDDEAIQLMIPPVRPNSARATRRYAALSGDDAHAFRRGEFEAIWGAAPAHPPFGTEDDETAAGWQREWTAFEDRAVPLLVTPDGHVAIGRDALRRLDELLDG